MFGFKRISKTKRKSGKNSTPPAVTNNNASAEPKMLYNIPSVSQIAPLPQNKSLGVLPVLSRDGRDAPHLIPPETSDPDQSNDQEITNDETDSNRQLVGVRYEEIDQTSFLSALPTEIDVVLLSIRRRFEVFF